MSDMRLVVAGAAGRMGRALIRAIAETDGVVLAGALDAPHGAETGQDSGELAGLGRNGIAVTGDAPAVLAAADGVVDFTVPAATVALTEHSSIRGLVHVIGTTGFTPADHRVAASQRRRVIGEFVPAICCLDSVAHHDGFMPREPGSGCSSRVRSLL